MLFSKKVSFFIDTCEHWSTWKAIRTHPQPTCIFIISWIHPCNTAEELLLLHVCLRSHSNSSHRKYFGHSTKMPCEQPSDQTSNGDVTCVANGWRSLWWWCENDWSEDCPPESTIMLPCGDVLRAAAPRTSCMFCLWCVHDDVRKDDEKKCGSTKSALLEFTNSSMRTQKIS